MTRAAQPLSSTDENALFDSYVAQLPQLPKQVRYLDDFTGRHRTLTIDPEAAVWDLMANGERYEIRFPFRHAAANYLVQSWQVELLTETAPKTVWAYSEGLRRAVSTLGETALIGLLCLEPMQAEDRWYNLFRPALPNFALTPIKSILAFCCAVSFGRFLPGHDSLVGSLSLHRTDPYAAVRSGKSLLASDEEAALVTYLDEMSAKAATHALEELDIEALRDACLLCISYQYAMRPKQTAMVRLSDVRIYDDVGEPEKPPVHITFMMIKQRSGSKQLPMTRKIKREWAPLFVRWAVLRKSAQFESSVDGELRDFFFGMTPSEVSHSILNATRNVNGIQRSATDLRHTAAQRLVDAGASHEELAQFMGHSNTSTGMVYYDISPTQADRINKALAISPTYSAVAEVARTGTIDMTELLKMSPGKQIGAAPHGIPIAGIGACDIGQSLCPKNPVTSCYTCPKFLPVNDPAKHEEVVESLRPVVQQFADASRGERASPAFMQLQHTLSAAQSIASQVSKGADDE